MNTERELTIDELDAVSGGAAAANDGQPGFCWFSCMSSYAPNTPVASPTLIHEPIHGSR
jgi:hypothetical protein